MLWELLLASVLGFLAVVPLAQNPSLMLPTDSRVWAISASLCGVLLLAVILLRVWRFYKSHKHPKGYQGYPQASPFSASVLLVYFKHLSLPIASILLTLLTSSSYGLYQYQYYQQHRLTQPITVTAYITSRQISDNISRTIRPLDGEQTQNPIKIGSGYQRQIWQIDKILPFQAVADTFSNGNFSQASSQENFVQEDDTAIITPTQTDNADDVPITLPLNVLVTADLNRNPQWQVTLDNIAPSDHLIVKLALQPIQQPIQPSLENAGTLAENSSIHRLNLGFDEAAWLRQRGVQATAQLLAIDTSHNKAVKHDKNATSNTPNTIFAPVAVIGQSVEKLRWQFRQKILTVLTRHLTQSATASDNEDQIHANAILLGLLTGDKGLMDSRIKHTYQVTGISHLLAISGPHVMMLASFIAFLVVAMVKRFYPRFLLRVPIRLLVLWVSVLVSAWYALLVGFELPAQRTVWMLLLVTLSVQWLLPLSAYRVLAGVGLVMLWLDSTAVTQAGFWLSFVAVGLLLKFSQAFQNRLEPINSLESMNSPVLTNSLGSSYLSRQTATLSTNLSANLWQGFTQLMWLQLWLFLLMMPVVVWFFGKVSLLSIVVNLVAVPFLGIVVVPLDMLAALLSLLPVIGAWGSEMIWQGLGWGLIRFHHGLQWLIDNGFAKQYFISIRPNQLILLALAIGVWLLPKGLLPRLLSVPLVLASMAVAYAAQGEAEGHAILPDSQFPQRLKNAQSFQNSAKLIVLDNTKLAISLWLKGDTAWLILADNHFAPPNTDDKPAANNAKTPNKFAKSAKKPVNIANSPDPSELLEQSIYPLLAKYGIHKLAGVVSQTPSTMVNTLVQTLTKEVHIEQYWLAGFDPLIPTTTFNAQGYDFNQITPQPCQAGQISTPSDKLPTVSAITGWRFNQNTMPALPPLSTKESWQTQICFIQITGQTPLQKSVLLMAGDSLLPLQMSQQLCTIKPVSLLVAPYNTPLTADWLSVTEPKKLHIITGKYANQQLPEDNQYAIADRTSADNGVNGIEVYQAGEWGSVIYDLEVDWQ